MIHEDGTMHVVGRVNMITNTDTHQLKLFNTFFESRVCKILKVNTTNIPKLNQHTPDQKNKQNAHDKTKMNGVCKKIQYIEYLKIYIFFSKFDTTGLCIL